MAIQFPNFLAAHLMKPDYSGIGDAVSNYYQGYNAPKDALIKKIQAQFAEPLAQESLLSSKLGNQKSRMEISKLATEMAQQREMERMFRQALTVTGDAGGRIPQNNANLPQPIPSNVSNEAQVHPLTQLLPGAIRDSRIANGQNTNDAASPIPSSVMPSSGVPTENNTAPNETIISRGSPHLAGIDAMYDNNPLSRAFLEKKGYKKSQQVKFDNKTGKTSIITTYPSGKVTVQSTSSGGADEGIPLTNKMITTHQRVISSVDQALPLLDELMKMDKHSNIYVGGNALATGAQADYRRVVQKLKDNLLGAMQLNPTEHGLKTIEDLLTIGGNESEEHYKKSIESLKKELLEKRAYSASEVKRSNKIKPIAYSDNDSENEQGSYSSNEWEAV